MTGRLSGRLAAHLKKNFGLYLLILFFFLIGLVSGMVTVKILPDGQRDGLQSILGVVTDNTARPLSETLQRSLFTHYQALILITLSGFTVLGPPVALAIVGVRGFSQGFTLASMCYVWGFKGALAAFLTLFIPSLILLPVLWFLALKSIQMSTEALRLKIMHLHMPLDRKKSYLSSCCSGGVILLGVVLFEAFLAPWILSGLSGWLVS